MKLCLILFILLSHSIYAKDLLCENKPEGSICSTNRICVKNRCLHKELTPLNSNDYILGSSLILGSLASILSGIGGKYYLKKAEWFTHLY